MRPALPGQLSRREQVLPPTILEWAVGAGKVVSPRENVIEAMVIKAILERGGVVDKVASRSRRGYFDLVCVIAGKVTFLEVKKPRGGRISPQQRSLHQEYQAAGASVVVVKSEAALASWLSTL